MTWYTFHTDHFVPTEPGSCVFHVTTFTVLSSSMESAYKKIEHRIPTGHRVFAWWENEDPLNPRGRPGIACNRCGGPWSAPTGHWEPEHGRVWCGRCAKDMYEFLKSMLPRRWGKVRFYDHAHVPPETPPPGWEP